ncbi:MAG: nicotinate-nucleotide adenylyltransferase [Anaerostipes sp.]|jgi:nicotinate-nucleotide adenylyltransferase|nr:nicotinate-nucleotide adenylyltransferase [Anaerostipes sp.]MDD3746063.1 nicotinate-nucleotide adenylyltransferase [Anaerostipes sp.]
MRRIGILGGTFNPIHVGHLIMGQCAGEVFELEKVLVMPTKNPEYKEITKNVSEEDRVRMIQLAIEGHPFFELSQLELQREGYTYTADTLEILTKEYSDTKFYFIMGADSLYQIESWKQPEKILSLATIVVASRNDSMRALNDQIDYIQGKYDAEIYHLDSPSLEISSNDIRRRVGEGKSIRYYVPKRVRQYIEDNHLYERKRNSK